MRGRRFAWAAILIGLSGVAGYPESPRVPERSGEWTGREELKVLGSSAVTAGDWPDCAAVLVGASVGCTGVLVAPAVVLTAAHCIAFADITEVYLATWDLEGAPGEAIAVIDEIAYPDWSTTYDLGILILERDSVVAPRLIAHGCASGSIVDGAPVTLVGWGTTDPAGTVFPTELMGADALIVDADCSGSTLCNSSVSPGGELAVGGGGVDSCSGDSGGPLYLRTPLVDLLVGINSRGSFPCGSGSVYVRPDALIAWIEQEADIDLPEPACGVVFVDGFESGDTSAWTDRLAANPEFSGCAWMYSEGG